MGFELSFRDVDNWLGALRGRHTIAKGISFLEGQEDNRVAEPRSRRVCHSSLRDRDSRVRGFELRGSGNRFSL